jgi:hypothetical protein
MGDPPTITGCGKEEKTKMGMRVLAGAAVCMMPISLPLWLSVAYANQDWNWTMDVGYAIVSNLHA